MSIRRAHRRSFHGEGAEALELAEKQLAVETLETLALQFEMERTEAGTSTGMPSNHDLKAALVELEHQLAAVVGAVSDESPSLRMLDDPLCNGGFVALAGRQRDKQKPPSQVHDDLMFHRKPATTET